MRRTCATRTCSSTTCCARTSPRRNSNLIKYANAVSPDIQPLDPAVRNDPGVYPPPEVRARLTPERPRPADYQRLLTRMWTRFKTGK